MLFVPALGHPLSPCWRSSLAQEKNWWRWSNCRTDIYTESLAWLQRLIKDKLYCTMQQYIIFTSLKPGHHKMVPWALIENFYLSNLLWTIEDKTIRVQMLDQTLGLCCLPLYLVLLSGSQLLWASCDNTWNTPRSLYRHHKVWKRLYKRSVTVTVSPQSPLNTELKIRRGGLEAGTKVLSLTCFTLLMWNEWWTCGDLKHLSLITKGLMTFDTGSINLGDIGM